jgi:hypothetical protein
LVGVKLMRTVLKCATIVVAAFIFTPPSSAQMIPGLQAMMVDVQGNGARNQAVSDRVDETVRRANVTPDTDHQSMVPTELQFSASPSRRRANLAAFVAKTQTTDPAGAAKMQALFASTDIIGAIDQEMRSSYGMRADNLADAYAVWWVSAWMGAQGRIDSATPQQMAMVKAQTARALSATPQMTGATDAAKQEFAEAMLVQAALIGATIETYAADPVMLAKAKASIAQGAKATGIDLSTMTLTDQGFVPVRKAR